MASTAASLSTPLGAMGLVALAARSPWHEHALDGVEHSAIGVLVLKIHGKLLFEIATQDRPVDATFNAGQVARLDGRAQLPSRPYGPSGIRNNGEDDRQN